MIHAAATIITETMNQPSKTGKNRRNENFWTIRMHRQISNRRKGISIPAEIGTGSNNGKLSRKKGMILKKYRVTNAREFALLTEKIKQKVQAKAQRFRRYEKRETQRIHNKMSKDNTKEFYRNLGTKNIEAKEPPIDGSSRALLEVSVGRKSTA